LLLAENQQAGKLWVIKEKSLPLRGSPAAVRTTLFRSSLEQASLTNTFNGIYITFEIAEGAP